MISLPVAWAFSQQRVRLRIPRGARGKHLLYDPESPRIMANMLHWPRQSGRFPLRREEKGLRLHVPTRNWQGLAVKLYGYSRQFHLIYGETLRYSRRWPFFLHFSLPLSFPLLPDSVSLPILAHSKARLFGDRSPIQHQVSPTARSPGALGTLSLQSEWKNHTAPGSVMGCLS